MKPIYLMFEEGVSSSQHNKVLEGLTEILNMGNVSSNTDIQSFGVWRGNDWLSGNTLNEYQSVDWYCARALNQERNQLNVKQLIYDLVTEPWQKQQSHCDIVITQRDLYADGCNFILGIGDNDNDFAISSAYRFKHLDEFTRNECLKTISMHEICHMLGVVNENRTNIEYNLGWHCLDSKCIMRQGVTVEAWVQYTRDRLNAESPLCSCCQNDLHTYVQNN